MSAPRPLTAKERALLARPDLADARELYADACRCSREHDSITARALRLYGDHGPQISGIVREHFPSGTRDVLRGLAQMVTLYSDEARAARPRRVRMATIYALARAVAARDGAGFYGPQP
jgi:hypothetical protein